jgi:hypothetical protein
MAGSIQQQCTSLPQQFEVLSQDLVDECFQASHIPLPALDPKYIQPATTNCK